MAFLALAAVGFYFKEHVLPYVNAVVDLEELGLGGFLSLLAIFTIIPHYVEITHEFVS